MSSKPPRYARAAAGDRDRSETIRWLTGLESAARTPAVETTERLLVLLADGDREVRRRSAGLLATAAVRNEVRSVLVAALGDGDEHVRWGACFALADAGVCLEETFAVALEALGNADTDIAWSATEMVVAHCREDPRRIADLERLVHADPRAGVRKMAVYCLGAVEGGLRDTIARALGDRDAAVRLAALTTILRASKRSDRARPAVVDAVRARLERDPDPGVRRLAAVVLGGIMQEDDLARRALERAARRVDDRWLARAAGQALARAVSDGRHRDETH